MKKKIINLLLNFVEVLLTFIISIAFILILHFALIYLVIVLAGLLIWYIRKEDNRTILYENLREISHLLFAVLIAITSIAMVICSYPTSIILLISAIGWYLSKEQKNILTKVSNNILLPTSVGLFILCSIVLIFNILHIFDSNLDDYRFLSSTEDFFIKVYFILKEWLSKFTTTLSVTVIFVLIIIANYKPKLKPVSKFLFAKKIISRISIALMTITSFTFFSVNPLQNLLASTHDKIISENNVQIREKDFFLREYIAAECLKREVNSLNDSSKIYFKILFREIHQHPEIEEEMSKRISKKDFVKSGNLIFFPKFSLVDFDLNTQIIEILPSSSNQLQKQINLLISQNNEIEKIKILDNEAIIGLRDTFLKAISSDTPELDGIIGKYIETAIEEVGTNIFDATIQKWLKKNTFKNYKDLIKKTQEIPPTKIIEKMIRNYYKQNTNPLENAEVLNKIIQFKVEEQSKEVQFRIKMRDQQRLEFEKPVEHPEAL